MASSIYLRHKMIDKQLLADTVNEAIAGTDIFPVEITVSPANEISVVLDSLSSLDIDTCVRITRAIEERFDRDAEDYELEVGSAGITSPLKVHGQFVKNVGNEVEVLTRDGRKLRGVLAEVADDGSFTIETQVKVRPEGAKRPVMTTVPETFTPDACKSVTPVLKF